MNKLGKMGTAWEKWRAYSDTEAFDEAYKQRPTHQDISFCQIELATPTVVVLTLDFQGLSRTVVIRSSFYGPQFSMRGKDVGRWKAGLTRILTETYAPERLPKQFYEVVDLDGVNYGAIYGFDRGVKTLTRIVGPLGGDLNLTGPLADAVADKLKLYLKGDENANT